jgi:hypothetical protein
VYLGALQEFKMPKNKNEIVTTATSIDTMKPLVKDYVDPIKDLIDFVSLRVPHISKTEIDVVQTYQNKAKTSFRFRVNYWLISKEEGSIVATGKIVKSLCIDVFETPDGLQYLDVTK